MAHSSSNRLVLLYATVDTFTIDHGATALALGYCSASGATLTGLLLSLDANVPPAEQGRSYGEMEAEFSKRVQANQDNAAALADIASRRGIAAETITTLDHSRGVTGWLADHARLHDLVIVGADRRGSLSDRMIAESLLFEIGRPLLVVPPGHSHEFAVDRLVVAWDNSRPAARAFGDALALFPGAKEIIVLIVGDEKAIPSALDDVGVTRLLARRGINARVVRPELRGRSIGAALQDSAEELRADLLVMGGFGHSRLREFILGGATLSVLDGPRLPVLLSH